MVFYEYSPVCAAVEGFCCPLGSVWGNYRELNPDKTEDRSNSRWHVINKLKGGGGYVNHGSGCMQHGPIVHADEYLGLLARVLALRFQPAPRFPEVSPKRTAKG